MKEKKKKQNHHIKYLFLTSLSVKKNVKRK